MLLVFVSVFVENTDLINFLTARVFVLKVIFKLFQKHLTSFSSVSIWFSLSHHLTGSTTKEGIIFAFFRQTFADLLLASSSAEQELKTLLQNFQPGFYALSIFETIGLCYKLVIFCDSTRTTILSYRVLQ